MRKNIVVNNRMRSVGKLSESLTNFKICVDQRLVHIEKKEFAYIPLELSKNII